MRNTPQLALFGAKGFATTAQTETRTHKPDVIAALRCMGVQKEAAEELASATAGRTAGEWTAAALRLRNTLR